MTLRYQEYIDKGLFKKCCREQDLAICNKEYGFEKVVICVNCEFAVSIGYDEDDYMMWEKWNQHIVEREQEHQKEIDALDWIDKKWPYRWAI